MAFVWTPEKISQLTLEEVKRLSVNAESKNNGEIVALCQAEIQARKPKPKAFGNLSEGFVRIARSTIGKSLESDVVDLLYQVSQKLEAKYDLGAEKARALSVGTKRFTPHKLTDAKGFAKVGGAQKLGMVVFDRYLSYRLGDDVFALLAVLPEGDQITSVRYQVSGSPKLLPNARPIAEARPFLPNGAEFGLIRSVEDYDNFEDAAERFMFLMEQVAPKRNSNAGGA